MDISVVIPLYNKERYIVDTVRSALGQTLPPREIVVVDDGSRDRSVEVLEKASFPGVRIIRQKNGGVSVARNTGIEHAACEHIAFLDADDSWEPRHLELLASAMEKHPSAVFAFGNYYRGADSETAIELSGEKPIFVENYFAFCLNNGGVGAWTSATLARRSALHESGGFPKGRAMGEDLDTWVRLADTGSFVYQPVPTARYTVNTDGGACASHVVNCDVWNSVLGLRRVSGIARKDSLRYGALMLFVTMEGRLLGGKISEARELGKKLPLGLRLTPYGLACSSVHLLPASLASVVVKATRKLGLSPKW